MNRLRALLNLAVQVLREIFDEAAYERFLGRTTLSSGAASYRVFLKEQQAAKARRPRCC